MKQYEEDGYLVTEFNNGSVERRLIPPDPSTLPPDQPLQPNEIDLLKTKLTDIQNTMDLILLKQEGLI